METTLPTVFK